MRGGYETDPARRSVPPVPVPNVARGRATCPAVPTCMCASPPVRQVLTNTESAARQYVLRPKAVALGWPVEQIVTIDTDQGQSGASAADRAGFQRLVAEVGMAAPGSCSG